MTKKSKPLSTRLATLLFRESLLKTVMGATLPRKFQVKSVQVVPREARSHHHPFDKYGESIVVWTGPVTLLSVNLFFKDGTSDRLFDFGERGLRLKDENDFFTLHYIVDPKAPNGARIERTSKDPLNLNYKLATDFSVVSWYKPDHSLPCYRRIAEFMDQVAVRIPDLVVPIQMLSRVVEGLNSSPAEKSLVVRQVRQALPSARRYMFNDMPSKLLLISLPNMGYVAASDVGCFAYWRLQNWRQQSHHVYWRHLSPHVK